MSLEIHNYIRSLGVDASTVPIYPGLLTFSFLFFHVLRYLKIIFFYFLEFYSLKSFENEVIQDGCLFFLFLSLPQKLRKFLSYVLW